jgi:hypothetical protein
LQHDLVVGLARVAAEAAAARTTAVKLALSRLFFTKGFNDF